MTLDYAIGVVHPENVPAAFCFSLADSIVDTGPLQILRCQTSRIDKGRNKIVEMFLSQSSKDWLLFIDADMTFTAKDLHAIREAANENHPIVSGVAVRPLQGASGVPVSESPNGRKLNLEDCKIARPIKATGAAFLLVKRWVLEEMKREYRNFARKWFAFTEHDGEEVSEDYEFCRRAAELNIPIRQEPIFVGHRKSFTLYADREPQL